MNVLGDSILKEARDTLDELLRIRDLNIELLETTALALQRINDFAEKNDIPLDDGLKLLIRKVIIIYEEIVFPKKGFIWTSDESLQHKKSDEELTECYLASYIVPRV